MVLKELVGARGFEPPTSCSQRRNFIATPCNDIKHRTKDSSLLTRGFFVSLDILLYGVAASNRHQIGHFGIPTAPKLATNALSLTT